MNEKVRIAAFGALNQGSYNMFRECMEHEAQKNNLSIEIVCAAPYPNAAGITEPGRPLRGDALKNPPLREELLAAVASDAKALGEEFDIYCMPCMSMIGFHDGIEQKLGAPILKLADAIISFYKDMDKVGVIHMIPAKKRVAEMFAAKAVTPDEEQAAALLVAEEQAKQDKDPAAVEAVMKDIVEGWQKTGLSNVLFARADAPMAVKSDAGHVPGIQINSYFDILAHAIAAQISL